MSVTLGLADHPTVVQAAGVNRGTDSSSILPTPPTTTVTPTTVTPTTVTPSSVPTTTVKPTTTTTSPAAQEPEATGALRRGDRGMAVRAVQQQLVDIGYWLGGTNDTFGLLTEQAITAFQKVEGLAPDGVAGPATQAALVRAGRPTTSASGDLLEIDKARQLLFVVRGGEVAWTLNTSTGTEVPYQLDGRTEQADTPPGHWTVDWAFDGDRVGPLGALYRPRYFHKDGIAVHGYHSVPNYPASHGCVRVTEAAMDWLWATKMMPIGSAVWVH